LSVLALVVSFQPVSSQAAGTTFATFTQRTGDGSLYFHYANSTGTLYTGTTAVSEGAIPISLTFASGDSGGYLLSAYNSLAGTTVKATLEFTATRAANATNTPVGYQQSLGSVGTPGTFVIRDETSGNILLQGTFTGATVTVRGSGGTVSDQDSVFNANAVVFGPGGVFDNPRLNAGGENALSILLNNVTQAGIDVTNHNLKSFNASSTGSYLGTLSKVNPTVPEPSTLLMCGLGVGALPLVAFRRRGRA
jgi:hypothetical protein